MLVSTKKACRYIAALVLLITSPSPSSAEPNAQSVYKRALPSVMLLEVENARGEKYVGSGVILAQDDVALTAWHVVSDALRVSATFSDGTRMAVLGCLGKDGKRDLAWLKLEKPLPRRRAQLNTEIQPIATRTYVIGAPKGYAFSISDGLISQIRSVDGFPQYQISCPISPGNSGGPLLDARGRVVAIVSWSKSDAQNLSFAIPSREIAQLPLGKTVIPWQKLHASPSTPLAPRIVDLNQPTFADARHTVDQIEKNRPPSTEPALVDTHPIHLPQDSATAPTHFVRQPARAPR